MNVLAGKRLTGDILKKLCSYRLRNVNLNGGEAAMRFFLKHVADQA